MPAARTGRFEHGSHPNNKHGKATGPIRLCPGEQTRRASRVSDRVAGYRVGSKPGARDGLIGKLRMPHEIFVDGPGALAPLSDGPDDQGLASTHISCCKDAGHGCLVI